MSDIATNDLTATPDPVSAAPVPPVLDHAPPSIAMVKTPAQVRLEVRVWCTFIFLICAFIFGMGLYLSPDPYHIGTGTHRQLGLPECGMMQMTGQPCPTCGCTTAVSYFCHGNPIASFVTQPFGFVFALIALSLLPLTAIGAVTGKWKGPSIFWLSYHWRFWTYGGVAVMIVGWIYKIIAVHYNIVW